MHALNLFRTEYPAFSSCLLFIYLWVCSLKITNNIHLYSHVMCTILYRLFFVFSVPEESLERISTTSYRSSSKSWTLQELIFICLYRLYVVDTMTRENKTIGTLVGRLFNNIISGSKHWNMYTVPVCSNWKVFTTSEPNWRH